jgi:hypothetical protein
MKPNHIHTLMKGDDYMKNKRLRKRNMPMLIAASVIACSFFLILVMLGFEWQKSIEDHFYF